MSSPYPSYPLGSSPPQQLAWGDLLSSSPLTGPSATFQSLRPRPNSFDHGKYLGNEGNIAIQESNIGTNNIIVFEDLPLSPFAEENNYGINDDQTGIGYNIDSKRDSEDNVGSFARATSGLTADDDSDDDGMMFKFDSIGLKEDIADGPSPYHKSETVKYQDSEPMNLSDFLSEKHTLSSFPSVDSYVCNFFLS